MTALDFPAVGLTAEQWDKIKTLAVSLESGQALWISGFFAGLDHNARAWQADPKSSLASDAPADPFTDNRGDSRSLSIIYGSETGNSADVARSLENALTLKGLRPSRFDLAAYKTRQLKDEQDLLVVTSTHGEGDPPQPAKSFFEFIEGRKARRLDGVRFAVLALGDSTYEKYCEAGKRLDRRLAELGATRLVDRVDCDVDFEEAASAWIESVASEFAAALSPPASPAKSRGIGSDLKVQPSSPAYDKQNPYSAPVLDNIVLTGSGSSKETRHVELSLEGSRLSFSPGDALGVFPRNDPALVDTLLELTGLQADAPVDVKRQVMSLRDALMQSFEITAATPRFVDHWAKITKADDLLAFGGEGQVNLWNGFLQNHHVLDIVAEYPAGDLDAQAFVAGFRPLQPRFYSIASSEAFAPGEVHLTVSTVRYELHGRMRTGVASGYLADRAESDTIVSVFVQPNAHFRLPSDDQSIIMIGAGTGIAPFRAFLQEREVKRASGKSWLFFGERNFHTDFLYQTEWQDWLKQGALTRMNVAFSRDQAVKRYVQHKLVEQAGDVYAWLQEGAHIYVCGDGTHLAPDVHAALVSIIRSEGARSEERARDDLSAMQDDQRYHIDVY